MTLSLVVAMGEGGVIGVDGALPWHLPADLAHFKAVTLGHPMIMGRATYESIGRPLPGRTTVVVTRDPRWSADGVEVVAGWHEALALAHSLDDDVFVVGGAQLYASALASGDVEQLIVSHVDAAPAGDTFFPSLDWSRWVETSRVAHPESVPAFTIVTYARR